MPGMSANSETVKALVNAVSAEDARTRCACAPSVPVSRLDATEMATNNRPMSAPATPAEAAKKSSKRSGVVVMA
jgi:hypothetical protein